MTLEEIKSKICDLRCSVEELQESAQELYRETEDKRTEEIASYFDSELGCVARQLSDLEDTEIGEDDEPLTEEEEEALEEWWDGLDNGDKANLVGIPAPSGFDGRGEDQFEFDDICDKWWNAKSASQKRKLMDEDTPWWEKE